MQLHLVDQALQAASQSWHDQRMTQALGAACLVEMLGFSGQQLQTAADDHTFWATVHCNVLHCRQLSLYLLQGAK